MAGESYTTKKILLKAVDGTTTQYFIPYVNNATADKTGLVKPDGTTITVDGNGVISASVDTSGLQEKITSTNKLSADLIEDGTTNKVVTSSEKTTWNNKQDAINDLATIRSNATAGASAATTIAGYGDIVTHNASEFLTEHQDISGKQDAITSTNKLSADLVENGTTNKVVTATEKSTWNNKQDAISDLTTIRSNATAGADAASTISTYGDIVTHDADEFAEAEHTHTKSEITDFPTIPTVNNATIKIQKNGTDVDSFTANQATAKTINITVPTSAADVSALPASTKYGATIDLDVNTTTYVVTATLKDQDGTALSTDTIDLPLESVVVSGSYNSSTKKVVLTLQNGSTIEFSVADLISGLQSEITSTNKLSADLIEDGTTNKVVTATEKATWNGKQDAIADLATIRSNASNGASAATTISGYGDIVTHDADEFAEANHTHAIADITNLQTTLNGKQATISDLATIRSNATAGAGAATTIAGYGDIVTHNASEFLTEHQDISGKQDVISDLATIRSGASAGATAVQPEDLADVATSGSYNDLADKPTIPTVGNAEIEIQKNGTKVDSFTTNQSGSKKTINITVPTNNNQLTNGAGYITSAALPTKLSDLTDDLGSSPIHTHSQYLTSVTAHNQASSTINALTGYSKSVSGGTGALSTSDTLNKALAKLENALDGKQASGEYLTSSSTLDATKLSGTIPSGCYTDTDTKNTAGTTNKAATKLFLAGAESQAANPQTYSNVNCYIGTDNCLYSNGSKVLTSVPSHNQASNTITAMTSYAKASSAAAIATTDSLNTAVGKLEYKIDDVDTQLQALTTILNNAIS